MLVDDCWFNILSFLCLDDILTMECCCIEIRNVIQSYDRPLFKHRLDYLIRYKPVIQHTGSNGPTVEIDDTTVELSQKTQLLDCLRALVHSLTQEINTENGTSRRRDNYQTSDVIQLKINTGANNFKVLKTIHLGNIFTCSVGERITQMETCLKLMGWLRYSTQFDMLLFKYYTFKVLFPSYPNNVAGILIREPPSMVPSSFKSFFTDTKSVFEEPCFKFESGEILSRFWILHYGNLANGFIDGQTGLGYSLLEIKVPYLNPSIGSITVLNNVTCPRNENFKAHGGCLVM